MLKLLGIRTFSRSCSILSNDTQKRANKLPNKKINEHQYRSSNLDRILGSGVAVRPQTPRSIFSSPLPAGPATGSRSLRRAAGTLHRRPFTGNGNCLSILLPMPRNTTVTCDQFWLGHRELASAPRKHNDSVDFYSVICIAIIDSNLRMDCDTRLHLFSVHQSGCSKLFFSTSKPSIIQLLRHQASPHHQRTAFELLKSTHENSTIHQHPQEPV